MVLSFLALIDKWIDKFIESQKMMNLFYHCIIFEYKIEIFEMF